MAITLLVGVSSAVRPPSKVKVLMWSGLSQWLDGCDRSVVIHMSGMKKCGILVIFGVPSIAEYINTIFFGIRRTLRRPDKALTDMSLV